MANNEKYLFGRTLCAYISETAAPRKSVSN